MHDGQSQPCHRTAGTRPISHQFKIISAFQFILAILKEGTGWDIEAHIANSFQIETIWDVYQSFILNCADAGLHLTSTPKKLPDHSHVLRSLMLVYD